MSRDRERPIIELGIKVSVRRSGRNVIGVVTRLSGDYVGVRWTISDLAETEEYHWPVGYETEADNLSNRLGVS